MLAGNEYLFQQQHGRLQGLTLLHKLKSSGAFAVELLRAAVTAHAMLVVYLGDLNLLRKHAKQTYRILGANRTELWKSMQ